VMEMVVNERMDDLTVVCDDKTGALFKGDSK
jgi:hypothetical protein